MASHPPFKIPFTLSGFKGQWQERNIEPYSDGDMRHWPTKPYRPSAQEGYLCMLAQGWAEHDGLAEHGVKYYLDKLPLGYACFEQDQISGSQVYKRLFGHPSGRYYTSTKQFLPHFLWLMSGMEGNCTCEICGGPKAPIVRRQRRPREIVGLGSFDHVRRPRDLDEGSSTRSSSALGLAGSRAQRNPRATGSAYAYDEEGNEDIWKDCIRRLETTKDGTKGIEIDIDEENSIDFRADRESLPSYLTQLEMQHSFVPRVGELVLWLPTFDDDHHLLQDNNDSEFKLFSSRQKRFAGHPEWRAGLVAATPSAVSENGPVDFTDILDTPHKKSALNAAGFRIETLPDPNEDADKSLSKQYKYVPMRNIRPLSHWQILLRGIPGRKLHPSVYYALTCMTSLTVVEKGRFNGEWPSAHISCKGLYLGSELITIGDVVRFTSPATSLATDVRVLVVTAIRLNLHDIKQEYISPSAPQLASSTSITLRGVAFRLRPNGEVQPEQRLKETSGDLTEPLTFEQVKDYFGPVGASEYGLWYPLHSPRRQYEISHDRVLGRMYEADAARLWSGTSLPDQDEHPSPPRLDFDLQSILAARRYATQADARLTEAPKHGVSWRWADSRAEGLAIETFHGFEVGHYHGIRDKATLNSWRTDLKIIAGVPVEKSEMIKYSHVTGKKRGRPAGSKLVNGRIVMPDDDGFAEAMDVSEGDEHEKPKHKSSSQMAGAALASTDDEELEEGDEQSLTGEFEEVPQTDGAEEPTVRKPLTKEQIMTSVEDGLDIDDDVAEEEIEEDWYNDPIPFIRGGTEESEGGDYHPGQDSQN